MTAPGKKDRHGKGRTVSRRVGASGAVTAKEPPPLIRGRVRCPACRNGVGTTRAGTLRSHLDLFGLPCPNRSATLEPVRVVAPPVHLPPEPKRPAGVRRPPAEPARLDVGSTCQGPGCGKWLPGERILCGRCYVNGNRP